MTLPFEVPAHPTPTPPTLHNEEKAESILFSEVVQRGRSVRSFSDIPAMKKSFADKFRWQN